jgi:hypothetical protein
VKSTFFRSPGLNFLELYLEIHTCLCLSTSLTLTICPKEGMTLMLMLLSRTIFTRFNYFLLYPTKHAQVLASLFFYSPLSNTDIA